MAKTAARKRGRPRRDPAASQGGLIEQIRTDLNQYLQVCETCHRPMERAIAPVAEEIGVNPTILSGFIRGTKGVSSDTLDLIWKWLHGQQNQTQTSEPETATASA